MNQKLVTLKNDVRASEDVVPALQSVTATGYSQAIPVAAFAALKVNILASSVSSGGVFRVWGSDKYQAPNFANGLTTSNWYQQIAVIDTGSAVTTPVLDISIDSNGSKSFELNTNGLKWLCVELDSRTDGTFSVDVIGYNL
jgi:hypothetical protein